MSKTKQLDWWRGEGLVVLIGLLVVIIALIGANIFGVHLIHGLLNSPALLIYILIGALVFAEAAIFLGFVIPGEAAVIIGGVLAAGNHVSLMPLLLIVIIAAIAGDSTGYWVGKEYGKKIIDLKILAHHKVDMDKGLKLLKKRGAIAIFVARFVAFLRAVMPSLAGVSDMPYTTFLPANAIGAIVWGSLFTFIGWTVGYSYHQAEVTATWLSLALLIFVILGFGYIFLTRRRTEINEEKKFESKKNTKEILEKEIKELKK